MLDLFLQLGRRPSLTRKTAVISDVPARKSTGRANFWKFGKFVSKGLFRPVLSA